MAQSFKPYFESLVSDYERPFLQLPAPMLPPPHFYDTSVEENNTVVVDYTIENNERVIVLEL